MNRILLIIYRILPKSIWNFGRKIYRSYLTNKYLKGKRPYVPGETTKAKDRRENEDFFIKFCKGKGLDIGFGGDPVVEGVQGFDFEHGDAQHLSKIKDELFDFVYSSHTLEHMPDPKLALGNWYRAVKPGGYLILYIPHRDLYEKKKKLPSRFNPTHTIFFLLDKDEKPDTLGIVSLIEKTLNNYEIIYAKVCDEGHTITDPLIHSDGEYSIEVVVRKKA